MRGHCFVSSSSVSFRGTVSSLYAFARSRCSVSYLLQSRHVRFDLPGREREAIRRHDGTFSEATETVLTRTAMAEVDR